MTAEMTPILLIPGAWMGPWIWAATAERLRADGCEVHIASLPGSDAATGAARLGEIGLEDHVEEVIRLVPDVGRRLVIVGHSYSGIVAGVVADRLPDVVARTVMVGAFFPQDGRSLLDDWGSSDADRTAERADIEEAGMIWAPPPAEGLAADAGLDAGQARWLGERLRPHPGRTILDPASMRRPITAQDVTVIADVGDGDPRSTLPEGLAGTAPDHWEFHAVPVGHWPMLSCPDQLDALLLGAATRATSE